MPACNICVTAAPQIHSGITANTSQIYVDDQYCGTIYHSESKTDYTIKCGDKVGSSIKLKKNGEFLMLCEVIVFGYLPGLFLSGL